MKKIALLGFKSDLVRCDFPFWVTRASARSALEWVMQADVLILADGTHSLEVADLKQVDKSF